MIRIKDVIGALSGLVGWEQNYSPLDMRIDEDLTRSDSGLTFQQVHPLLTLSNLASVAPNFDGMTFPVYSSSANYVKGDLVTSGGDLYRAVKDGTGHDVSDATYWMKTDLFSDWLRHKTNSSIAKAVMRFVNEKLNKGTYKMLFENQTLFDGTGRIVDREPNRSNVCGFELVPIRAKGITTKINKIGLQFSKAGDYTVYIMHSSLPEPYRVLHFTKQKDNAMEWFALNDVYLPYSDSTIDAGGSWYVVYNQNELPAGSEAIKKNRDWSKEPCTTCSRNDYASWVLWSKYFEVHPFYVNSELVDTTSGMSLWDVKDNNYVYTSNYGINLDITVACDITDTIIGQRHLFADVVAKQVGADFLREFAYNSNARANRSIINASKTEVLYELDGDSASMKKSGLNYQLDLAFKAIELTFEGIDRACLPCNNGGIKYRSI